MASVGYPESLKLPAASRIFFPYSIESIPVHRKHPKCPCDLDFQVADAVSILPEVNFRA